VMLSILIVTSILVNETIIGELLCNCALIEVIHNTQKK